MKVQDFISVLQDRMSATNAKQDDCALRLDITLNADGAGRVTLSTGYDELHDFTDEPWQSFGDLPIAEDRSGTLIDHAGRIDQFVEWDVTNWVVARFLPNPARSASVLTEA